MQDQIQNLLTAGVMIKFFLTVLSLAITIYFGFVLDRLVKSFAYLRVVSGSFRISKGVILRFGTATGTKDGMLMEMDRKRVEIEFDGSILSIPTSKFADMEWDVVKPGEDTMNITPAVGDTCQGMPCRCADVS